jgi:hypothetical protein
MNSHRLIASLAAAAIIGAIGIASAPRLALSAGTPSADVTVPQSALNSLIGEPDRHFHQAADLYVKGNASGAASEIKAAAALIRMEAARGSADDAAKLQSTAANLDTTADDVVNGNLASRRDLDLAFARADLALAAHYRAMADNALAEKDRSGAARWLKAAGDSVDQAASWTGQSPSGAQAQAWDQMHALQAKIRTSANWSYDEARKGVGYLGSQIQYLGQQMQNFSAPGSNSNPTGTP